MAHFCKAESAQKNFSFPPISSRDEIGSFGRESGAHSRKGGGGGGPFFYFIPSLSFFFPRYATLQWDEKLFLSPFLFLPISLSAK